MQASLLLRRHEQGDHDDAGTSMSIADDPGNIMADPFTGQWRYALAMAVVCSSLIGLVALARKVSHSRYGPSKASRIVTWKRYLAYKSIHVGQKSGRKSRWLATVSLPNLAMSIFLAAFVSAFTLCTFLVLPYYRTDSTYGSPPLALRSGMFAFGLLPFVYALSSKVNLITLVSGISHSVLLVLHKRAALFVLFLAAIHTAPFFIQRYREGGSEAVSQWFREESMARSGTAAFVLLFILVSSSLQCVRNRCYEVWVILHIAIALAFLGVLFDHTGGELTTWRYLWGTVALYGISTMARILRQLHSSPSFLFSYAHLEVLPDSVTRISVTTSSRWSPGQHFLVRFPTVEPWSSHPFTAITLANAQRHATPSTVVFMAKMRKGVTEKVYRRAETRSKYNMVSLVKGADDAEEEEVTLAGSPSKSFCRVPIILDGPYGNGASIVEERCILYLAGGSGISFIMASLVDLAWRTETGTAEPTTVKLVWSIRSTTSLDWIAEQLEAVQDILTKEVFTVDIHVTGQGESTESEAARRRFPQQQGCTLLTGRPHADRAIRAFIDDTQKESVVNDAGIAIVSCGPRAMMQAAAESCARLQWERLRSHRYPHIPPVRLVTEAFAR